MRRASHPRSQSEGERPPSDASIQSLLYLAGLASFLGPASISIYTPSLVALRESFGTNNCSAVHKRALLIKTSVKLWTISRDSMLRCSALAVRQKGPSSVRYSKCR